MSEICNFQKHLSEDIKEIMENNPFLKSESEAFNFWVLENLYEVDPENISRQITERNDKCIDCFVDFPDRKELFLIQNKYYGKNTSVKRESLQDFLNTPLAALRENKYTRSEILQQRFNEIKNDPNYKIYLHFYVTNDKRNEGHEDLFAAFTINNVGSKDSPSVAADIFYLNDMAERYYGTSQRGNADFVGTLKIDSGLSLSKGNTSIASSISYISIFQIYELLLAARQSEYSIFEQNIREYLGVSAKVNKGIIKTLGDPNERQFFSCYNQGITMLCEKVENEGNTIKIYNPQIINGCQTASSIYKVLLACKNNEEKSKFENVTVALEIFVCDVTVKKANPQFNSHIIRYRNTQSVVKESAFTSREKVFKDLKSEFEKSGFWLCIKPSDKNTYKEMKALRPEIIAKMKNRREKILNLFGLKGVQDIEVIELNRLLQVLVSTSEDAPTALDNRNSLLIKSHPLYETVSSKVGSIYTTDNMIGLYLFYRKSIRVAASEEVASDKGEILLPGSVSVKAKESKSQDSAKDSNLKNSDGHWANYFMAAHFKSDDFSIRNNRLKALFDGSYNIHEVSRYFVKVSKNYLENLRAIDSNKDMWSRMKDPINETFYRNAYKSTNATFRSDEGYDEVRKCVNGILSIGATSEQ